MSASSPYLIIGIDPGHTVGVAALDLSGHLLHTAHVEGDRPEESARTGLAGAISIIEKWGTPSLIATDVRPAPDMALKLAASFNVPLFVPQRPWREEDKRSALKEMAEKLDHRSSFLAENAHERDALSAAIAAWRSEQNLLRKADNENLVPAQKERFKHLLLQGYRHDFALQKITEENRPAQPEIHHVAEPESGPRPKISSASSSPHLLSSERANAELRKRVLFLEQEREGLLHRIRLLENGVAERMLNDRALRTMQAQITRLQLSLRQTYARFGGPKAKQQRQGKPASSPRPPAHLQPKPSPGHAHPKAPSKHAAKPSALAHPPSLKEADEKSVLEKLVHEYRRGRRT